MHQAAACLTAVLLLLALAPGSLFAGLQPTGNLSDEQRVTSLINRRDQLETRNKGLYHESIGHPSPGELFHPDLIDPLREHDQLLIEHEALIDALCLGLLHASKDNTERITLPPLFWENDEESIDVEPAFIRPALLDIRGTARLLRDDARRLATHDNADPERCALRVEAMLVLPSITAAEPDVMDRVAAGSLLRIAIEQARESLLTNHWLRGKVDHVRLLALTDRYTTDDPIATMPAIRRDRTFAEAASGSTLQNLVDEQLTNATAVVRGFRAELEVLIEPQPED